MCPETRLETVTSKPTLPPTPHKLLPFPAPSSFSPALEDSNKREWNQWTLTWTPGPRVALILATGPGGQVQCTINGGRPQRQVLEVCQTVIKGTAGHGLWCYWLCAKVASVTSLCEKLLFRAFWWTSPRHCRLTWFFFKEISYSFEKQNEEKPFACCYNSVLSWKTLTFNNLVCLRDVALVKVIIYIFSKGFPSFSNQNLLFFPWKAFVRKTHR